MTTTPSTSAPAASQHLARVTGISGLLAVLLVFAVLVGSRPEPAFDAPPADFLTHYRAPNTLGSDVRSFGLALAMLSFVWFVVTLTTQLRRAEGEAPWRSNVAMVSGLLFATLVLSGNEVAAVFTADDLDPQVARYAFEESQAAFANARVALGSCAICCGWALLATRFLPRWLGWLAIASGVGLVLARLSWTSYVWLLPYLAFWLWTLVVAVLVLRRGFRGAPGAD